MTSTKLSTGIAALIAIASVTTTVVQHRKLGALRTETETLRQELAQGPASSPPENLPDADEQARRRKEHEELVRLRGEVTLLRQQQQEWSRLTKQSQEKRFAVATGQGPQGADLTEEEQQQQGILRLNCCRQWVLGLILFAGDNEGLLPDSLDKALAYVGGKDPGAESGLASDQFQIFYKGSLKDISEPNKMIVFREKEAFAKSGGGFARTYGFADGHSEIHHAGTIQDFERWESERMQAPQ